MKQKYSKKEFINKNNKSEVHTMKKLQVFISSTYIDLTEERQSAVEAILDAGHIPAGMELFKAGNESQLSTVKKWIDESDVYLLILGGRYGSIEEISGKSYTHLEYEYALERKIPIFSVVINDGTLHGKVASLGQIAIESMQDEKYIEFKTLVKSKMIKEVDDVKDIKLAIHATLTDFIRTYELDGWVRGSEIIDNSKILQENNKLLKENTTLKAKLEKVQNEDKIGKYDYSQLKKLLENKKITLPQEITEGKEIEKNFLELFDSFTLGINNSRGSFESPANIFLYTKVAPLLINFGLLDKSKGAGGKHDVIQTSKIGKEFLAKLELENQID